MTRSRWKRRVNALRPSSLLTSLDRALVDPPLLCCDDDELCEACRTESPPVLIHH